MLCTKNILKNSKGVSVYNPHVALVVIHKIGNNCYCFFTNNNQNNTWFIIRDDFTFTYSFKARSYHLKHGLEAFFIEIPNFWAWAHNLGK